MPARISAMPLRFTGIVQRFQIEIRRRKRRCHDLGKSFAVLKASRQILQHDFHLRAMAAKVNCGKHNLQNLKGKKACR
ncbi:MAG: hypothetical protein IRZ23_09515 [Acetobacteraceae bacterium]|nr:hypothetical protein [Acetobacteraceae bacterium]